MPVCQYCGKELNEGMMCDCSQAQAASSVQEAIENDDIKIENFASGSVQPDGQSPLNRSFSVNNPFKGRISKTRSLQRLPALYFLQQRAGQAVQFHPL